ncbi:DUF5677 domain-containing protein [Rhodovulum tesquicola]|uniref:DUF5677 domain-containing protein n=1 Tax=Rhodovulum tesquicola TaxID=540254 RepID=UPI0020970920|nr:DUF5677 domain-containing protein [Rhodovulum tesquicola]MCO8146131.1 DUF5677 domain-containing protein [Rhodovulum tesquicola]
MTKPSSALATVKFLIASTIEFTREAELHCIPFSRHPDPSLLQEISFLFLRFSHNRTEQILRLLNEGTAVSECLILMRSVVEASAKLWDIQLADTDDQKGLSQKYASLLAAETRRKRQKYKEVIDGCAEKSGIEKHIEKLISDPTSIGLENLSRKVSAEIIKSFSFGVLIEQVEKRAKSKSMEVNFSLLRLLYSYTSDISHAGATGLLIEETLYPASQDNWSISHIGNAASICGTLTLIWYYNALFEDPHNKSKAELYESARRLLEVSTSLSNLHLDELGVPSRTIT